MTAILEGEQRAAINGGVPRRSGRARMPSDLAGERMPVKLGPWARKEKQRLERERAQIKRATKQRARYLERREGARNVRVSRGGVITYKLPPEWILEICGGCCG